MAANLHSYHLRVRREAGLVVATRRGRWVHYRLDGDRIGELWARGAACAPLPGEPKPQDGAAERRRDPAYQGREM